jgi:AraC-like DNA-binding protein
MKKIALLFMLLSINILNAKFGGLGGLPMELQLKIILELNEYNTVEDAVKAIKNNRNLSEVDKELYDIINDVEGNEKEFMIVINTLARKFFKSPKHIADLFGTTTAQKYSKIQSLNKQLVQAIKEDDGDKIQTLIDEGAEVNHTIIHGNETWTPLTIAVMNDRADIVKTLLENGANPHFISGHDIMTGRGLTAEAKAIDYLYFNRDTSRQAIQQKIKIKKLLEEAMQKSQ